MDRARIYNIYSYDSGSKRQKQDNKPSIKKAADNALDCKYLRWREIGLKDQEEHESYKQKMTNML